PLAHHPPLSSLAPLFLTVYDLFPRHISILFFFFLMLPPPPRSTLFPYTTLFRSLGFHKQMDNRIKLLEEILSFRMQGEKTESLRSEERFSRNAETDLVCRLLLEKKKKE